MESNDKKQRCVAEKLGISGATLHEILKKGLIPSLKTAIRIEKYTNGEISVYDWIGEEKGEE